MQESLGLVVFLLGVLAYVAIAREHDDNCECSTCRQRRNSANRQRRQEPARWM